jgi:hypothetical protein
MNPETKINRMMKIELLLKIFIIAIRDIGKRRKRPSDAAGCSI